MLLSQMDKSETDVLLQCLIYNQIEVAFKFMFAALKHYQHGKNAFLLRIHKLTPGSSVADEPNVPCLRDLGFPTVDPCRNKL